MIRVTNKRHGASSADCDVYIGRPSILGNPYMIGRDGTRDDVVNKYECYARQLLVAPTLAGLEFRAAINELCHKAIAQEHVHLVCWCAPLRCHGDVLVRLIEEQLVS